MKNPMTTEQQCQAVIDNASGYAMQFRGIDGWQDRTPDMAGTPLNFSSFAYRRKPELVTMICGKGDTRCSVS